MPEFFIARHPHTGELFLSIRSDEPGYVHKFESFNHFSSDKTRIPDNFAQDPNPCKQWIKDQFYNPSITRLIPDETNVPSGTNIQIIWNGGIKFICWFQNRQFTICKKDPRRYVHPDDYWMDNSLFFTKQVLSSNTCTHVFGQTLDEHCSILVRTGQTKYIYVGRTIFSFECSDTVEDFQSSGDGECYLVTDKSIYFFFNKKYVDKSHIPTSTDYYGDYYKLVETNPSAIQSMNVLVID